MTNHIEEMMRTAGVEKNDCENCDQVVNIDCLLYGCDKQGFPDFTAEKQLEVIKLIGSEGLLRMLLMPISKNWEISAGYLGKYEYGSNIDFNQALAELTTELMKAGELDKEKVKGILEG